MTQPRRLVLATDSATPSGVGEHMLSLAQALHEGGDWRVSLVFPETGTGGAFLDRAGAAGFEVRALAAGEGFAAWLRRGGLLHVHAGIGWEGHGLAEIGRAAGLRIVRTEHLPYLLTDEGQRGEHLAGLALVDHVILVSEAAAESFRAGVGACVPASTIRNGIDPVAPRRSRAETRSALGLAPMDPAVLMIARFTAQKGHADLLAAMREVVTGFPGARLLLVGEGPERAAMEARARDLGLAFAARFLGERRDVPELLAAADLLALPSHFEGLPLVVLEAMAAGLPVVATRVGGTVEALGADYPWLVAPGAPAELSARLLDALGDADRRRRMARRNRRRFTAQFRASRMAEETARVYRALLGPSVPARRMGMRTWIA